MFNLHANMMQYFEIEFKVTNLIITTMCIFINKTRREAGVLKVKAPS